VRPLVYFALGVAAPISIAADRNAPHDAGDNARVAAESAWIAVTSARQDDRHDVTCRSLIGLRAARALVRFCIYQSAADRPLCSVNDNHCMGIVYEIRRNLRGDRGSVTLPGAGDMTRADWRRVAQIPIP
jgi:hypothetical protein